MKRVLAAARPFFEEYIGDLPDLKELMRLHWVAEHLDDRNIPEMGLPRLGSDTIPPRRN